MKTQQQLIADIGATDQQYLQENSAELALKRAKYRLELIHFSKHKQEKIYFLQESIVILEQARLEFEEIALHLYLNLSILLAQAYMTYFELQRESHFAIIVQQILKPLAHYHHADIYYYLAYASAVNHETALMTHWLKKYLAHDQAHLDQIIQNPHFAQYQKQHWWYDLIQHKLH